MNSTHINYIDTNKSNTDNLIIISLSNHLLNTSNWKFHFITLPVNCLAPYNFWSYIYSEADILSGWWREEAWRGDVNYAAYVCQVLSSFFSEIERKALPLSYISNDNGFLNQPPAYFDQRTLLVRFVLIADFISMSFYDVILSEKRS